MVAVFAGEPTVLPPGASRAVWYKNDHTLCLITTPGLLVRLWVPNWSSAALTCGIAGQEHRA